MLRRSIFELYSRRSIKRITRQIAAQPVAPFIYSRKEFSSATGRNGLPKPNPIDKQQELERGPSKVVLGTAVVAGAFLVAYQAGYLDEYLGKEQKKYSESTRFEANNTEAINDSHSSVEMAAPSVEESGGESHSMEAKHATKTDLHHSGALSEKPSTSDVQQSDVAFVESTLPPRSAETYQESTRNAEEKSLPQYSNSVIAPNGQSRDTGPSSVSITETESLRSKDYIEPREDTANDAQATSDHQEKQTKSVVSQHSSDSSADETQETDVSKEKETPASLLEEYHLKENAAASSISSQNGEHFTKDSEALVGAIEELNDGYLTKDGKLVFDFLAAIHAAEKRQAELDARVFSEEKRVLKERYENEIRDLRARELMRIEEAALLDKELKRERAKAAAAIKSIQEKMEEKLRTEIEHKETEAEMNLKKVQDLAKAELAATVASEKAAQIEKMAEANLHINALCMAFYARSEEARQSHSVHKLSLGAIALEDAVSKGLPIQKEIDALQTYLEGIQKDSILDLVLSSLPEETRHHGTDTLLQLSQEFNTLKKTLRHYSLIPPGGGGILTHSLAHLASWLKVKEVDQGDGIESIIKTVDLYLAEGKLTEAAEALEQGVKGSQAEAIVSNWIRQARNRAITEQALTLLQSYATCVSLT